MLKKRIRNNYVKRAKKIKGVVSDLKWNFSEPKHYIIPQLYFQIVLVNMVLDNFYGFIEDQIEALLAEEKVACISVSTNRASLEVSNNKL